MVNENHVDVNYSCSKNSLPNSIPADIILKFNLYVESFLDTLDDVCQKEMIKKAKNAILSRLLDPFRDDDDLCRSELFFKKPDLRLKNHPTPAKIPSSGISKSKERTLRAIAESGVPASAKDIISKTLRSRSVESNYLNQLWKDGFLEKTQDQDGSMLYYLNEEGNNIVNFLKLGSLLKIGPSLKSIHRRDEEPRKSELNNESDSVLCTSSQVTNADRPRNL
jgi:DNA-binding MarR family transcriptional regulator